MLHLVRPLLIVALLIAGAAILLPTAPKTASLAGDVGLRESSVCTTLEANAHDAVRKLTASRFPHATTSNVETYRLVRDDGLQLDANGSKERVLEVEAQVRIDWARGAATCLPSAYLGPVDATLILTPHAYASLVGEIRHVLDTGRVGLMAPGAWISLAVGTSVDIPGNEGFDRAYKYDLAAWAAGAVIRGSNS